MGAPARKICIFLILIIISITACKSDDQTREALRSEALSLYRDGDYEEAIRYFDEALDVSRGEVSEFQYDILKYRAECELRSGDYESARNTYTALLSLDESLENEERYTALLEELGKLDEISEANRLFEEGSYQEAYDKFSEEASLDGSMAGKTAWFNQAVCAEYLGDFADAYALFSRFTEEYPDDAPATKEAEFCRSRMTTDTVESSGTS